MGHPKVSVIVTVYNSDQYLKKCVDSLLCQTLRDIEIILVDDGSVDNSPAICDEYALIDNRIKVIHKENGGVSDARNAGIRSARGDYIVFVDSDDWCEELHVERLHDSCVGTAKAISASGYYIDDEGGGFTIKHEVTSDDRVILGTAAGIIALDKARAFNLVWNKIYSRQIVNEHGLLFVRDGVPAEDLLFNCGYLKWISSIVLLGAANYHYRCQSAETQKNRYDPDLPHKVERFVGEKRELYAHHGLLDGESTNLLRKTYISYMSLCIANLYRTDTDITFEKRREFFRGLVANDELQRHLDQFESEDLFLRLFKRLVKTRSALTAQIVYGILFRIRHVFDHLYQKTRRRRLRKVIIR